LTTTMAAISESSTTVDAPSMVDDRRRPAGCSARAGDDRGLVKVAACSPPDRAVFDGKSGRALSGGRGVRGTSVALGDAETELAPRRRPTWSGGISIVRRS
jgi:hypothetical protein